jgi:hypothetical protein
MRKGRWARSLLAPFLENGELDIAEQLARPLPASIVCSLLGFPGGAQVGDPRDLWEVCAWMADRFRVLVAEVAYSSGASR